MATKKTRAEEMAAPHQHGYYAGYCPCGWITARKGVIPTACEKCNVILDFDPPSQPEHNGYVRHVDAREAAGLICTVVDNTSYELYKHAEKHGYCVSHHGTKYMVFKIAGATRTKFGTENVTAISYLSLEWCYTGGYQGAMQYVKAHTPPLPAYLHK